MMFNLGAALEKATWSPHTEGLAQQPPAHTQTWLTKPHILGDALAKAHGAIEVQLLSQDFAKAFEHERVYLNTDNDHDCWVREVYLYSKEKILTYGRVTIPPVTFKHNERKITELKNQSFGKVILYSHPNYKRSDFEYAVIQHEGVDYWCRRSLFWLDADPLIVTEIYMTDLGPYPECSARLSAKL